MRGMSQYSCRIAPIPDQYTIQFNSISTHQKLFAFDPDVRDMRSMAGILCKRRLRVDSTKMEGMNDIKYHPLALKAERLDVQPAKRSLYRDTIVSCR